MLFIFIISILIVFRKELIKVCSILFEMIMEKRNQRPNGDSESIFGLQNIGAVVMKRIIYGVLGLVGVLILYLTLVVSIMPGYMGVVYNINGGIESPVLNQGWHVVAPWKKVTSYPVSTETVYMSKISHEGRKSDDSLWVNTKDGKQVNIDITYAYHMNPDELSNIFTKFRGQSADVVEWGFMKNEIYRVVNEVTSQYPMMDLVGDKRPEINEKCDLALRKSFHEDGIELERFNLSRIEPDAQTVAAIQAVVNAQNVLKQTEIERQQAQILAEKRIIEARGIAESTLIVATGQVESNQKLQQSLTDNIVKSEWIKRWDGKMPTTELGGSGVMVNLK